MQAHGLFMLFVFITQIFAYPFQSTTKFSSIVAFGDSFTDNGNGSFKLTNGTWPADPGYFKGRFSNGPVWVENIASNLSIPLYDYAYGGATTDNNLVEGFTGPNSTIAVPGVAQQVSKFLSKNDTRVDIGSTFFIVFGGFNDVFFNPNLTAVQIAAALSGSVTRLINAGARHFLLLNYYDASEIPYDQFADDTMKNKLTTFSVDFGKQVELLAEGYRQQLAGEDSESSVTYVDLVPLFKQFYFYGKPSSYGYDAFGAYGSCLVGAYEEVSRRTLCSDSDRKVFWDEYHPARTTHRYIAHNVLAAL
jgi:phospholipase/lecithinase/hemolysin